jgi:hypothetical protein
METENMLPKANEDLLTKEEACPARASDTLLARRKRRQFRNFIAPLAQGSLNQALKFSNAYNHLLRKKYGFS